MATTQVVVNTKVTGLSQVQKLEAQIAKLDKRNISVSALLNDKPFLQSTSRINRSLDRTRGKVGSLTSSFAALGGTFLLLRGVTTAVKQFAQLETTLTQVRGITGATATEFAGLEQEARRLGRTTIFSANQVADGMRFLAQAGLEVQNIFNVLPQTLLLAQASSIGLAESADLLTNVMAAFGAESEQASFFVDTLTTAVNTSNTDILQLGQAMQLAAPIAKVLGVNVEEAATAIGILGNNGIQATAAGTGLRRVLIDLTSFNGRRLDIVEALGLTPEDLSVANNGLGNVLQTLKDTEITESQLFELFGKRGAGIINILSEQNVEYEKNLRIQRNAKISAEELAEAQRDTLRGGFLAAKSAAEGFTEAILGTSGAGSGLQTLFELVAVGVNKATDEMNQGASVLLGTLKALAAFMVGKFLQSMGTWIIGITSGTAAMTSLTTSIAIAEVRTEAYNAAVFKGHTATAALRMASDAAATAMSRWAGATTKATVAAKAFGKAMAFLRFNIAGIIIGAVLFFLSDILDALKEVFNIVEDLNGLNENALEKRLTDTNKRIGDLVKERAAAQKELDGNALGSGRLTAGGSSALAAIDKRIAKERELKTEILATLDAVRSPLDPFGGSGRTIRGATKDISELARATKEYQIALIAFGEDSENVGRVVAAHGALEKALVRDIENSKFAIAEYGDEHGDLAKRVAESEKRLASLRKNAVKPLTALEQAQKDYTDALSDYRAGLITVSELLDKRNDLETTAEKIIEDNTEATELYGDATGKLADESDRARIALAKLNAARNSGIVPGGDIDSGGGSGELGGLGSGIGTSDSFLAGGDPANDNQDGFASPFPVSEFDVFKNTVIEGLEEIGLSSNAAAKSFGDSFVGAIDNSIESFGRLAATALITGGSLKEVFQEVGRALLQEVLSALIAVGARMLVNFALQQSGIIATSGVATGALTAQTAAAVVAGKAATVAWTPAAIAASLASFGGNAIPATAGIISTAAAGSAAILASGVTGALQDGGPARAGSTYLVGERGPELFTPGQSGIVTPNERLGGATDVTVNVNVTGNIDDQTQAAMLNYAPILGDILIERLQERGDI